MCPSSGETTLFLRHLVLAILCGWYSDMQEHMLLHIRISSVQNIIRRNKFVRHLVLVILCGWLSGMQGHMLLHTRQSSMENIIRRNNCVYATLGTCILDSHPHRITSTKSCINTVVSPNDGHIVARNMSRMINILRINILRMNCAPSWLYL